MHRVIIPVDFSETSLNAARYTAGMLANNDDVTAIIYHNYETADDLDISLIYQETLKREFQEAGVKKVECEHEMGGDLIENIARMAHTIRATLIVMGITGKSALRQVMFGSNTLKLIDKNLYPVMIIPPDASYKGMKQIAFATDFNNVELSTPSALITSVLEMFSPTLHIFHVFKEKMDELPSNIQEGKEKLKHLFPDYNMNFNFLVHKDFYTALDAFIYDKKIDVLITIPKHQSNSTSLFKSTHTKKLAYHSHIPILAAHQ